MHSFKDTLFHKKSRLHFFAVLSYRPRQGGRKPHTAHGEGRSPCEMNSYPSSSSPSSSSCYRNLVEGASMTPNQELESNYQERRLENGDSQLQHFHGIRRVMMKDTSHNDMWERGSISNRRLLSRAWTTAYVFQVLLQGYHPQMKLRVKWTYSAALHRPNAIATRQRRSLQCYP